MSEKAVPRRVLVVCHANTARSVMAHKLIERMVAERGLADRLHVTSAGVWTYARDGMIPSLDARLALREVGIELAETAMASTALREHPEILAAADLVLTMTAEQTALVRAMADQLTAMGGQVGHLTATGGQVDQLIAMGGQVGHLTATGGQVQDARRVDVVTFAELAGESGDIADPAGQGEDAFRAARDAIMRCLALGFDRMVERALG